MNTKKIYLVCFSILPLMVCVGMIYSIISLYILHLGASRTQVGIVFTVGAIAGTLFGPYMGKISDRVGRRLVIIYSMMGFSLVFIFYAVIDSYKWIIPVQFLEGTVWVAFATSITALIADISPPEERGWAMGVYNQTWNLGWVIGPISGGYLSDKFGFKFTLVFGALIIIFGTLCATIFIKEPEKAETSKVFRN